MVVKRANQFLEQNRGDPFFLYVALNTPHYPEQPPEEYLKRYDALEEPRRTYAAFVAVTDDCIGRVMKQLEALGLRQKTIIVFMSDNGHQSYRSFDLFQIRVDNHKSGLQKGHRFSSGDGPNDGGGNTGKWIGHKGTFLEGGIRVPAIISYPARLPSGQVRRQAITVMDWYPTILELCGIQPPSVKLDGRSLLGVIRSDAAPSPHPVLYFQWQNKWAVREGDWKLIRHKGNRPTAKEHFTLHNLADENPEVTDYVDKKPEKVKHLSELYDRWQKEMFGG
jgi:arylsulfatase A-like enzyme